MQSIEPASTAPAEDSSAAPNRPSFFRSVANLPTFRAFHYPQFRLLWYGQVGNGLSLWMDQVARGWLMWELTGSAVQLGGVTAIRVVPMLLLSPVAGTMADRYGRRRQLVISQSLNFVLYAAMAVLIYTRIVQPWHVYVIAVLSGVVQVFQGPARQAMTSESVEPRDITNAIGVSSIAFNGSRTIGPAVSGVLIAVAGTGASYLAQAILYLLSTIWTIQLDPSWDKESAGGRQRGSFLASTLEGWRFVQHDQTVRTGMIVLAMAAFLAQPFGTLLPIFAKEILGAGSTGQGFLLTGMGVGALLSAVSIASLGDRLPKGYLMLGGAFFYGLLLVGFAFSAWYLVSILLMVVIGMANVFCNALIQTVVQTHSPPAIRGRVMGVFQLRDLLSTAGAMLIGILATVWGAPWAVATMGATCALGALAVYFGIPHARTIR
ncbi:MAG TPA: MFS transporter [Chloroflexota bacterium]